MIEDDCRNPVLVMRAARFDTIRGVAARDVRVGDRLSRFRIENRQAGVRVGLIRCNDTVAAKRFRFGKILSGLPSSTIVNSIAALSRPKIV